MIIAYHQTTQCDYIEMLDTCIGRIRTALKDFDCLVVKILYNTLFTLGFVMLAYNGAIEDTSEKTTQKTSRRILEILRKTPSVSRKSIAQQLGDITEDGVKYHLDKMKTEGLIKRVGPAKGGHWHVND